MVRPLWSALLKFNCNIRNSTLRRITTARPQLTENDVEEVRIPVPWGHISGKWWGDKNEIPILGLHGWQDNANSFDEILPKLNVKSFLALDAPGHGISSYLPPGRMYNFLEYVFAIRRIVNHFKWKKVPIFGHSLGGVVGYVYSSLYPDEISYLISFECARSLVMMYNLDIASNVSSGIDKILKIEKQLIENSPPAYQLSEMVKMYCEGSMGSISPESALILLKRGAHPADNLQLVNTDSKSKTSYTDLIDFVQLEKLQASQKLGSTDKLTSIVKENQIEVQKKLQSFSLVDSEDKTYIFTRDPRIKVNVFGLFNEELLKECAKKIKCPVLSLRAQDGFLHGSSKVVYESTNDIMKKGCELFEHVEVKGTHHSHLNTPDYIAPHVNDFISHLNL